MMVRNLYQVHNAKFRQRGSFITPVLKQQWSLSSSEVSLLASIFYLGIFFGSILSGKLSDQYGRRKFIIIGTMLQIATCLLFLVANDLFLMCVVRWLYGFSCGFTITLTTSMYAQSAPIKYRGKGLLLLNFWVSLGKIIGIFLAYIFLESFTKGNWKAMMVMSGVPSIIVLYGAIFYMNESPRFLLANQRYDEAFEVLNKMIDKNNSQSQTSNHLTNQEKIQIIQWRNHLFENKQPATIKSLFDKQYFSTTISLSICWFAINFMYFGQLVVLPFIFGKQDKSFGSYILTIFGQAPSFLVSLYLIDRPNFGRKKSMMYFFALSGVFHFGFAFERSTWLSSICRFFMKECFQMLYPCTTESFGTFNRTLGFGFSSAIGRLGSFIMPYIILPMADQNLPVLVFLTFAVIAFIGSFSSYHIPRQPMNRPLDQNYSSQSGKESQHRHNDNHGINGNKPFQQNQNPFHTLPSIIQPNSVQNDERQYLKNKNLSNK